MPPTTVLTVPGFQVWGTVTFGLSYQELRKDGFTESCYLILLQILTFFFFISSLSTLGLLYVSINLQKKHFLISSAYLFKKILFLLHLDSFVSFKLLVKFKPLRRNQYSNSQPHKRYIIGKSICAHG